MENSNFLRALVISLECQKWQACGRLATNGLVFWVCNPKVTDSLLLDGFRVTTLDNLFANSASASLPPRRIINRRRMINKQQVMRCPSPVSTTFECVSYRIKGRRTGNEFFPCVLQEVDALFVPLVIAKNKLRYAAKVLNLFKSKLHFTKMELLGLAVISQYINSF